MGKRKCHDNVSTLRKEVKKSWPSITERHDGIVVTFAAGYGSSADNVPQLFTQAILLQVGKWFTHRGDEGQVHGQGTS